MKNILLALLMIFSLSCKSQIVPLETHYEDTNGGTYFKDLQNEMNKFVGTWQFTNANDTLTLILEKKTHVYDGEFYEDLIVGEYRYVLNGQESLNTLPRLDDFTVIGREHNISGRNFISNNEFLICDSCSNNEKRIRLHFHDPDRLYLTTMALILRYMPLSVGSNEEMTATLISEGGLMLPDENSPTEARVPYGEYLLVKQ